MFSQGSFDNEAAEDARKRLDGGHTRDSVVTHLRFRWNMDREEAEEFLKRVERQAAISRSQTRRTTEAPTQQTWLSRIPWGTVQFAVFAAILVLVEVFSESPIGTSLSLALVVYVLWRYFKVLRWIGRKLGLVNNPEETREDPRAMSSADIQMRTRRAQVETGDNVDRFRPDRRVRVAAVAIGAVAVIVGLFAVFLIVPSVEKPLESEFVWTDHDPVPIYADRVRFAGRIENANDTWTITEPVLIVSIFNEAGLMVAQRRSGLSVPDIRPNESVTYFTDLNIPESFDTYQSEMEWEWVQ